MKTKANKKKTGKQKIGKKGKPVRSLLGDFMDRNLDNYIEPTRKGLQKGEPIGFSYRKYHAALCFLYDYKSKEITGPGPKGLRGMGEVIGVSYGLLRKWRTEEPFIKEIKRAEAEFSIIFCQYICELGLEIDLKKKPVVGRNYEIIQSSKKFIDVHIYSPGLKERIVKDIKELIIKMKLKDNASAQEVAKNWQTKNLSPTRLLLGIQAINIVNPEEGRMWRKGFLLSCEPELTNIYLKVLEKTLENPKLSKADQAFALDMVWTLKLIHSD